MPQYCFEHPTTGEVKQIFIPISAAERTYSEDGVVWNRVWTVPQASFDSVYDCDSPKDFAAKTANKRGSLGDLWSKSAELSEKRAKRDGIDPIRQKHLQNYHKKTGKKHPDEINSNKKKTAVVDITKGKVSFE